MPIAIIEPWNDPRWDAYVASHPRASVYHTSAWIRVVCEIGRYPSLCLLQEREGRVAGVLPMVAVESRLTGRRVSTLPFSDACGALVDAAGDATDLLEEARAIRLRRGDSYYEMRGRAAPRDGSGVEPDGFARSSHFRGYTIPLQQDPARIRATFSQKAVRYMISKAERMGVSVRRGDARDIGAFYALYVATRRRHGIPPQPRRLFALILERLGPAIATLYLAQHEGRAIGAVITARYNGVTYLKYEVTDDAHRHLAPVHALIWRSIEDAVAAGDRAYDFGRTAADNRGLNEFKSRWGTVAAEMPYYFDPPREGLSVVRGDSLKYRVFTAAFRRMPSAWAIGVGERIFRHFG